MMKFAPLPLLLLLVLTLSASHQVFAEATKATPALPEGVLAELAVDQTWAGHPVKYALLTERGHQFIAYYDADRKITVVSRRLDEPTWTCFQPEGVFLPKRKRQSNVTGWDSHNYLTLALDRDGYLHLSGNLHVDPLIYYRSARPFDVTSLERLDRMTGKREEATTYPVFFKNAAGDLCFRYRDGGSGDGSDIYNGYDTTTRTWKNLLSTPLINGEGQRNAYAIKPTLGPDGRFHLIWMWRDTPDAATSHTLCYARSSDLVTWEKSDGTPLQLPITFGTSEVIDSTPARNGLINMTFNLGFDVDRRPVAVYHRYDDKGKSQIYAARPAADASSWEIGQISDWDFRWNFGGSGSLTAEVTIGAPTLQNDRSLLVDYSTTHSAGAGRWKLDPVTLRVVAKLPPPANVLPAALVAPVSDFPGMQTVVSRKGGRCWVLRWETLPRNRDKPHPVAPPPSALRLYELPLPARSPEESSFL